MQSDPPVIIRDMRPGEEKALLRAARRAFIHSPFEQVGISKPKSALVAEVNGSLAGAMFLRVFPSGEKKTGYLDVGFVVKEYRGHGIGRALYPAATERLRAMGCDPIAAMVIDDNVASWKSLENQGFGTPSLTGLVRKLGFVRAASIWLQTLLCAACGTNFWMSGPIKERSSAWELLSFLWVNMLLFAPALLQLISKPDLLLSTSLAYPSLLLASVLFGGIGCLIAGNTWRFSFPRGGMAVSLLLNSFGSVFPMVGRWYLKSSKATAGDRRAMGIQAIVEWIGMLLLFSLGAFLLKENDFLFQCASLSANLLIYHLIPFMPFGAFGGARVWAWSKAAFALLAVVTIAVIIVALR